MSGPKKLRTSAVLSLGARFVTIGQQLAARSVYHSPGLTTTTTTWVDFKWFEWRLLLPVTYCLDVTRGSAICMRLMRRAGPTGTSRRWSRSIFLFCVAHSSTFPFVYLILYSALTSTRVAVRPVGEILASIIERIIKEKTPSSFFFHQL